jgi:hypothetical protein
MARKHDHITHTVPAAVVCGSLVLQYLHPKMVIIIKSFVDSLRMAGMELAGKEGRFGEMHHLRCSEKGKRACCWTVLEVIMI